MQNTLFSKRFFHNIVVFMFAMTCSQLSFAGNTAFAIEKDDSFNKFSDIRNCKMKNNWVKPDKGPDVSWDIITAETIKHESDNFMVLRVADAGAFQKDFLIGRRIVMTIDNEKSIRLDLDSYLRGKYVRVNLLGASLHAFHIPDDLYKKLQKANSIAFSIEGSSYSDLRSLDGTLSSENISRFREFDKYCSDVK